MVDFVVILVIIVVAAIILLGISRGRAKENGARGRGGGSTATFEKDRGPAPSDRAASAQRITPPTWNATNMGEILPTIDPEYKATPAQLEAVQGIFGSDTPSGLSVEQASLILDAREYVRGVINALERENEWVDQVNALPATVAFIIGEEAIREYVHKWGRGRFQRGTHYEPPRLRRNDNFAAVRGFMLQHTAPK